MSKHIITINRMYGSGGRVIGKVLADKLGYSFYDKELIEMASKEKQVPFDQFASVDEKKPNQWRFSVDHEIQISPEYYAIPMNDVLFEIQRNIILSLAEKGNCVIVGRCANHILRDKSLTVFIHAPFDLRVRNIRARTGREEKSARKMVKNMDKQRRAYYEFFTDEKWTDLSQYDICLDSSRFTEDQILEILTEAARDF